MQPTHDVYRHAHNSYWRRAHRDWKFWIVLLIMLTLMIFYVMSDNFALRGRGAPNQRPVSAEPASLP